jgi:hypothetical protein
VEAVVWLHNLTEKDEVYLLQLELHYTLSEAKIKNLPHKYIKDGSHGLIQFYIPTTRWDKSFFEQIAYNELGDKFMKIVTEEK